MRRTLPRALRACSVPAMDLDLVGRRAAVMASSDGIGKAIACALAREGVHVMMCGRDEDKLAGGGGGGASARRPGRAGCRRSSIDLGLPGGPARLVEAAVGRVRRPRHPRHRTPAGRPPGRCSPSTTRPGSARSSRCCCPSRAAPAPPAVPRGLRAGPHRLDRLLLDQGHADQARLLQRLPAGHPRPRQDARRGARPKGITVNLIAPGKIDTARVRWLDDTRAERTGSTPAEVRAASEQRHPAAAATASRIELAEVAVFLCSKAGRYVSGTAQLVDGGIVRAL